MTQDLTFAVPRRKVRQLSLTVAASLLSIAGFTRTADAAVFTQTCIPGQTIDFNFDTNNGTTLREKSHNNLASLQNNLWAEFDLRANPSIKGISFLITNLDFEPAYDYFEIADVANPISHRAILTGAGTGINASVAFDALQSQGGIFRLVTDSSVGSANITFWNLTTTCGTPGPAGYAPLRLGKRTFGILTGTNDTVYMSVPLPSSGDVKTTLALFTEAAGEDFDLYVRCNALPTPDIWNYRGFGSTSQEFVTIPPGTCPGQTMYVAVNSFSGRGVFSLVASHSFVQTASINAVTTFPATTAQIDQFANTLVNGMKVFYGMTEGGWLAPNIKICNQAQAANCPNPVFYFRNDCERSNADITPGFGRSIARICTGGWDQPRVIAHEAGHAILKLPDEYYDVGSPPVPFSICGHSIMAAYQTGMYNLCRDFDHKQDKLTAATIPPTAGASSWQRLNVCTGQTISTCFVPSQMMVSAQDSTPDAYSYLGFAPPSAVPAMYPVQKFY